MRRKIQFLLSVFAVMLAVVAVAPVVSADDREGHDDNQSAQQERQNDSKPNKEEINQRINQRKTELKTRVSTEKQNRIKRVCKASQGRVSSVYNKVKGFDTSRTKRYTNLVDRLNKLTEKLKEKNVDTTQLEQQITGLEPLVDAFNTDLAAYKQAVSDLSAMDCETDPTGFQAALETARSARAKVYQSAKAVRTYLKESIKPTLQQIRQQLENQENTSNSGDSDGGNQ